MDAETIDRGPWWESVPGGTATLAVALATAIWTFVRWLFGVNARVAALEVALADVSRLLRETHDAAIETQARLEMLISRP